MSIMTELIDTLRRESQTSYCNETLLLQQAANTIEEQGAKLQRLNMERSSQYYNNGWIPCSERLPEKAGFYVVTKRQKSGEIQVALGSYRPLFNEWSGNGNFKEVLAWIPLPEPYNSVTPNTNLNHKTNADRIRSMSNEELADKIFEMDEALKFALPFCGNSVRCADVIYSDEGVPDEMCKQCLMDWLKAESEG